MSLNQGGGQVLFGVTRAGVVAGQQVSERTIEELRLRHLSQGLYGNVG